uniref:Protein kinase domain-containing protein n=1 Tax=Amphimedon queenslandica TaxID=400682 RepID=A0A1X7U1R7_AMPQE
MPVPSNRTMRCVLCNDTCPKECTGGVFDYNDPGKLTGCTVITTELRISSVPPNVNPSILNDLNDIREICGSLDISGFNKETFPYLSSLKTVGNDSTQVLSQSCNGSSDSTKFSVIIANTDLVSIDLSSLETVINGGIQLENNPSLCYLGNLSYYLANASSSSCVLDNHRSSINECVKMKMTCHPQCSSASGWCWGPNDTQCVTCTNFIFNKQCVPDCHDFDTHRVDLAARNALVQSHLKVLITDFGLTRFIEPDESHYEASGSKLPVRWLPPESIRQRIFTHKTDIWSFGVTVWEILTFGESPFKGKSVFELLKLLEKGDRLKQPKTCTLVFYKSLQNCWELEPEKRPSFEDLVYQFNTMMMSPKKYVKIKKTRALRGTVYTSHDGNNKESNFHKRRNEDTGNVDCLHEDSNDKDGYVDCLQEDSNDKDGYVDCLHEDSDDNDGYVDCLQEDSNDKDGYVDCFDEGANDAVIMKTLATSIA